MSRNVPHNKDIGDPGHAHGFGALSAPATPPARPTAWRSGGTQEPAGRPESEPSREEIEGRFRWARQQGHPGYLWPAVPIHAWRACLHEIERATARVLGGAAPVRIDPPGDTDADALGIAAFTSGMGPLLGHWLERGRLGASPAVEAVLGRHLEHGRRRWSRMEATLERTLALLAAADAPVLVIKGADTAVRYFPEPGTRPAMDLDLVVPPGAWSRACDALEAAGCRGRLRQRSPRRQEWLPPEAPRFLRSLSLTHADNPYGIDLHDSLERDFNGVRRVRFGVPWSDGVESPGHGGVRGLPQPLLLALLAAHASEELHNLTMLRLVELVLVIRADEAAGRLDWDAFMDLLEERRATRFVYPALALAERLSPRTVPGPVLAGLEEAASPRLRRVLSRLRPSTAQRLDRLSLDERFMWAETPLDHVRRAADTLWPGSAGGSLRRLGRIYAERLYRLLRGRVAIKPSRAED